jgi:hypothetical protein
VETKKATGKGGGGSRSFHFDDVDEQGESDYENDERGRAGSRREGSGGVTRAPSYNELAGEDALSPEEIRRMSTGELQKELMKRGLPTSGSKPALIARLTAVSDFLSPRSKNAVFRGSSSMLRDDDEADDVTRHISSFASELQEGDGGGGGRGGREGGRSDRGWR